MAGWNAYTGPHEPGYTEQVYLLELFGDQDAITQAILKSPDGKRGALLSFSLRELPFRGKTREAAIRPCKAVSGCPRNLRLAFLTWHFFCWKYLPRLFLRVWITEIWNRPGDALELTQDVEGGTERVSACVADA